MNFLAHYLTAAHLDSPEFHAGAILPDVSRRAGFRILSSHLNPHLLLHPELVAGIRLHWLGDELFHHSELFNQGCEIWKSSLQFRHQPAGRRYFLFHLLSEMWLDRLLLSEFSEKATDFYRSLASLPEHRLTLISDRLTDTQGRLWNAFQDFQQRRFLLEYADDERFASIAAGVFAHAGRMDFSTELKFEILKSMPEAEQHKNQMLDFWASFIENLQLKWKRTAQNFKSE